MMLSPHFSLEELTHSAIAVRLGIDNSPPEGVFVALGVLADGLEKVRALLGHPLIVNSGYRSALVNQVLHGAAFSAHLYGYAADFICPQYGTPLEIVRKIRDSGIQFDQCIQEGTWVHISFDPKMRQQVLTATFDKGRATYTQGV